VEWAKTRARADRWREELLLLEEEMRRSLDFCWWRSQWWRLRVGDQSDTAGHIAEGLSAYALEQSAAEQQRAIQWSTQWSAVRERAQTILTTQLSNVETQEPLAELAVEIEDEEREEEEEENEEM
jgi:hypothetical protein